MKKLILILMLFLVSFNADARIFDFAVSTGSSGSDWTFASQVTVYFIPSDEPGTKSFIVWYKEGADSDYTLDGTVTADSTIIDLGTAMGVYLFKVQQKRRTIVSGHPTIITTPFDEAPVRSVRIGLLNHANDDTLKHNPPVTGNANKYLQVSADGTKIEWDTVSAIADTIVGLNDSLIVRGTHIPASADSQVTTKGVIALDGRGLTLSEDGGKGITVVDGTGAVLVDSTVDGVDIAAHAGNDSTVHMPSLNGHAGEYLVVASDSSKAEWSAGSAAAHDINGAVHTGIPLDAAHGGTGYTTFTNGQILVGQTTPDNDLNKTTLTGGEGIRIYNGLGEITVIMTKADIDTVGVITDGTWQGGIIPVAYGGTSNDSYTTEQFIFWNSVSGIFESSGYVAADFADQDSLEAHGYRHESGGADSLSLNAGQITAGILPTARGGTGSSDVGTAFDNLSPMTALGDLIIGGVSGSAARLAVGTSAKVLIGGSQPSWGDVPNHSAGAITTGVLALARGGTNNASFTNAKFLVYNSGGTNIISSAYDNSSFATGTNLTDHTGDTTIHFIKADIDTVGTINEGTWHGSMLVQDYGGTGFVSYTNGQLMIGKTTPNNEMVLASLTGGDGMYVTNGEGSITLSIKKSDIDSVGTVDEGTWHGSHIVYSYLDTGIGDTKILRVDHASPVLYDYAKFTSNGIEGRSYAEVKADLSLNNVDNTSLASWAGTTNVTTLGTITTGTWQGTTVAVNQGGTGQTSYTNGQLLIGSTSGNILLKGSISGGTGITVSPGGGTISVAVTGSTYAPYSHINATGSSAHSATNANTAGMIVARDASGNFSAGTITATLSGSATSANSANFASTAGSVSNSLTASTNITMSGAYNGGTARTIAVTTNAFVAYADRLKWNGGSSGLVAATGRSSLGLGTIAVEAVGVTGTFYSLESSFKGPGDGQLHHMRKAITVTKGIITAIGASTDYNSTITLP